MHPVARAASVVGAGGAVGLAYASLVERNAYALRRVTVPVLPAGHRPLRVVHVSDLHLMPGQRRKAAWVAALADLRPDLVVNTGDNISHPDAIPVALEAFSAFEGVPVIVITRLSAPLLAPFTSVAVNGTVSTTVWPTGRLS